MYDLSEKQINIILITIQLIADEGVNNLSIRKLAGRVGVTEAAIYRHFESKDDLMIKLADYITRNWHLLFGTIKIQKYPVAEQTKIIFSEVINYFDTNREFAKTLLSTNFFATDTGMTEILLDLKKDGLRKFAEFLAEGQEKGEVRGDLDAETVANIFFGTVWWEVTDWIAGDFQGNLPERWKNTWKALSELLEKKR